MNIQIKLFNCLIIAIIIAFSTSCEKESTTSLPINQATTERFNFSVNGVETKGKIYLPASYSDNKNLPVIYLIDYQEQHFKIATDEFEKVINGVNQIEDFDALIVTLDIHNDIDAHPGELNDHYEIFKNMALYVDEFYTNNSSRTFMGRGSEAGIVLLTLIHESPETSVFDNFIVTDSSDPFINGMIYRIENNDVPDYVQSKKLHFSFSEDSNYANCNYLIDLINDSQFPWLKFESVEYPDKNFENAYPISFAEGLKFIFGS